MVIRNMEEPNMMHHQAVKHILRNVKETTSYRLKYQRGRGLVEVVDFIDSDLAGDINDRKSTIEMTFYLNINFISW